MKIRSLFIFCLATFIMGSAFKADEAPSTDSILNQAFTLANKEKKHVIVIFQASWCGWCHTMENSINDPGIKPFFDKNYVIVHLTVLETKEHKNLENPGAADLLKKYNSDGFGIPIWYIFDQNGTLVVDSHIRPLGTGFETKGTGAIGCPASEEEVNAFLDVLKKTSTLSGPELAMIGTRFRKNDPKYKGD